MANLIKMDLRRVFRTPMFYISLSIVAVFNILLNVALTSISKFFMASVASGESIKPFALTEAIASPFYVPLFVILMFASVVNFFYADISGGFIKNIAGQLPRKSNLIFSKYIVSGVHNLVFFIVGSLTHVIGYLILSATGMVTLTNDGQIAAALVTLLLKWLLSMAITAILLFVTNGIKNKVLASVVGVIIGTGSLGLAYMGLSSAINNVFHADVNVADYTPDSLMNSVNVATNTAVINALIVSLICIALFLGLTVKVFNSRDVK